MTRALVVYCHPSEGSFVESMRDRAIAGLGRAGAEIRVNDLYADGFDPAFGAEEWSRHLESGAEPSLARYVADLVWADMLVLVYPTWWSGQPAMLKGWIDRVWVNGVAWDLPEGGNRLEPLLRNVRRIVAVTSHGSSKFVNALEGEGGKRTITRSLRTMCHPRSRTTWLALYGVDRSTPEQRRAHLRRVEDELAKLAG